MQKQEQKHTETKHWNIDYIFKNNLGHNFRVFLCCNKFLFGYKMNVRNFGKMFRIKRYKMSCMREEASINNFSRTNISANPSCYSQ